MDFTTPVGSSSGKALHLVATADIEDMTGYTVTMYNNGSSVQVILLHLVEAQVRVIIS